MHPALRDVALRTLRASGAVGAARWLSRYRLLVLTYHGVVASPRAVPDRFRFLYRNCVTAQQLEAHMRYLNEHYTVLDPSQLADLASPARLPRRAAAVTFDDALRNNYTVAAPILRAAGVSAVFFAPTGFVDAASRGDTRIAWRDEVPMRILGSDASVEEVARRLVQSVPDLQRRAVRSEEMGELLTKFLASLKRMSRTVREECVERIREAFPHCPDPEELPADASGTPVLATMTWGQIRELAAAGMAVGSHTVDHVILSSVSQERAAEEIGTSTRRIEEELGSAPSLFSYPNGQAGDFRQRDVDLVRNAGYEAAFTQIPGLNRRDRDPFRLRRINVPGGCSLDLFRFRASGLYSVLRRVRG